MMEFLSRKIETISIKSSWQGIKITYGREEVDSKFNIQDSRF
jgi:hypothetical protein